MKKYLIIFLMIMMFPILNINALETLTGTFPDLPTGYDRFIITERTSNSGYRLFVWKSSDQVYVRNKNSTLNFYKDPNDSANLWTQAIEVYNLSSNEWVYYKNASTMAWSYASIVATTDEIHSFEGSEGYSAGYGLPVASETEKSYNYTFKDGTVMSHEDIYSFLNENSEFFRENPDAKIICESLNAYAILSCKVYHNDFTITSITKPGSYIRIDYTYIDDSVLFYRYDIFSDKTFTEISYRYRDYAYLNHYNVNTTYFSNFDLEYIDESTGEYVLFKEADFDLYSEMLSKIKMTKSAIEDLDKNSAMLVEIDFSNSYDSSYKYQIKNDNSSWEDVTDIINVNTYRTVEKMQYYNTTVYARVLDSNDNVLYENSIVIDELNDFSISIENGLLNDENNNLFYNVEVNFLNAYDEDLTYRYSFDNEKWFNITELSPKKVFSLNTGLDIDIFFQILNSDNEIVLNQTYRDFYELNNDIIIKEDYRIDENDNYIYIVEVDFTNVRKYEYLHSGSNFKYYISPNEDFSNILTDLTNLLDENNKYKFEFTEQEYKNSNFNYSFVAKIDSAEITAKKLDITRISFDDKITNIQDEKLNNELNQDYSDTSNIIESVKNFIKAISTFVSEFFRLIMYFFNKLNIWIRTCIISLFIVMIICKIIKVVRK